jgi:hypothetical protein
MAYLRQRKTLRDTGQKHNGRSEQSDRCHTEPRHYGCTPTSLRSAWPSYRAVYVASHVYTWNNYVQAQPPHKTMERRQEPDMAQADTKQVE